MTAGLRAVWRDHKLLLAGFVLAVAVMLFFAVRSVMFWIYWADPAHREEPIAGWMTPRYVAHSWAIPPEVLRDALAVPPDTRRMTINALAESRGVTPEEIIRQIEAVIAEHRSNGTVTRP
ncbi:hypothetical protein MGEO_05950 [Marivita geojedonensis]|uniref:Uncharacterized protein n=1 Tax=Marivita geojedonensis TaxID=1123756 RepID=A0A1X4NNG7_9RHOB|nr:hypothetical protein [Marivita geojedonensis]OSQ52071.1 hypothetical protein MGEO_05950 [Marivita geojedonensis]PRY81166.1 hypothetical protein CLV76_102128 [Marivita geojedonensis]